MSTLTVPLRRHEKFLWPEAATRPLFQTMSIPGEGASAPAPVRAQLDRLKGQPQEG
uniref:Uncharacterized protein n=1 Tax=Rhizobium leguminosarum bv. viciae TaxID=387 RepID=A0A0U2QS27_RHILV|nr:hypothetical protein [Rhizobium leguminosarum bv. viciae]